MHFSARRNDASAANEALSLDNDYCFFPFWQEGEGVKGSSLSILRNKKHTRTQKEKIEFSVCRYSWERNETCLVNETEAQRLSEGETWKKKKH